MIWHVIQKDLRTQWWLGPTLIAAAIGYFVTFDTRFSLPTNGGRGLTPGMRLHLEMWPYVVAAVALARAVQLDLPAVSRGDWHTRPTSRRSVIAAKVCLALGGVILPWGLSDFSIALTWQLTPAQALAGAAMHMAAVGAGLLLLMAIAGATGTMVQFLLAAAALLATVMPMVTLSRGLVGAVGFPLYASPGLVALQLGLAAAGAMITLFLLYHRRRLARAWLALLLATIGVELAGMAAGLVFGLNWPPNVLAAPSDAKGVRIEAASNPVVKVVNPQTALLFTPLRIVSPADLTLEIDRGRVDRIWANGQIRRDDFVRGWDHALDTPAAAEVGATPEPVKVDARYRLRVRRTLAPVYLKGGAPFSLPGGGSCHVISGGIETFSVQCLSSAPLCLDVAREGDEGPPIASGCGENSRIRSGFYTQGFVASTDQAPVIITRNQVLGMIDREVSTGWATPTVEPVDKAPPPLPNKPA